MKFQVTYSSISLFKSDFNCNVLFGASPSLIFVTRRDMTPHLHTNSSLQLITINSKYRNAACKRLSKQLTGNHLEEDVERVGPLCSIGTGFKSQRGNDSFRIFDCNFFGVLEIGVHSEAVRWSSGATVPAGPKGLQGVLPLWAGKGLEVTVWPKYDMEPGEGRMRA
jgi:hypothetical protein